MASGALDVSMRDALARLDAGALETLENAPRGVSMVIDPTGTIISDVASTSEAIVYADIDVSACVEPKQFHDVVGYYNRFDIFQLRADRTPREPAEFSERLNVSEESDSPESAPDVEAGALLRP